MDKKEAEEEAKRKAKDLQASAGKNSGMSGRDLVCAYVYSFLFSCQLSSLQFQYNPEWFQDEDEGEESDDFDLEKYRKEKEEEDLAAEEARIAGLSIHDGPSSIGASGGGE